MDKRRHRPFGIADSWRDKRKLHARRKSKCTLRRYSYIDGYEPRLCPRACWTFDSTKCMPVIRDVVSFAPAVDGAAIVSEYNANSEVGSR